MPHEQIREEILDASFLWEDAIFSDCVLLLLHQYSKSQVNPHVVNMPLFRVGY